MYKVESFKECELAESLTEMEKKGWEPVQYLEKYQRYYDSSAQYWRVLFHKSTKD